LKGREEGEGRGTQAQSLRSPTSSDSKSQCLSARQTDTTKPKQPQGRPAGRHAPGFSRDLVTVMSIGWGIEHRTQQYVLDPVPTKNVLPNCRHLGSAKKCGRESFFSTLTTVLQSGNSTVQYCMPHLQYCCNSVVRDRTVSALVYNSIDVYRRV
jgi:hypothetical protein